MRRPRLLSGLAAGSLLFVACGGGSDEGSGAAAEGEALPEVDAGAEPPADGPDTGGAEADAGGAGADAGEAGSGDAAESAGAVDGRVDLVGETVVGASDSEDNPLPDVVVDDLQTGQKVNFRNLVPQDKPVLLWFWAPH